jgi:LPS-assembly lipoprotein
VVETVASVLVTRSDEVTRNNLNLVISYRLQEYRTGAPIWSGSVNSLVSYNLVRADYANLVSERDARARAARDGAEQLRISLGNFFSRRQKSQNPG